MKKFLSLFVVMLLVLNFIPLASFAAETQTVSPNEVHIDKDALKDVTVTISGTLSSIMNGTGTLSSVYDYSVSGNSVTIKKNYLNYYTTKFPGQNVYLNFNFASGTTSTLVLYPGSSAHVVFTSTSQTMDINSIVDAKFGFLINGNTFSSIKAGEKSLVPRIDYSYSPVTQELIIKKGYLASIFCSSNNAITLQVNFLTDKSQTVVITPTGTLATPTPTVAPTVAPTATPTPSYTGTKYKDISAGYLYSTALTEDGKVVGWGSNSYGQLNQPSDLKDVVSISAGRGYRCFTAALDKNGKVYCWQDYISGQCKVPVDLSDVKQISTGYHHTLALKNDGTVVAWGTNEDGECNVPAGLKDVIQVAAGAYHSLALKADGTVVGWGNDTFNEANVPDITDVKAIAANYYTSVAIKNDGTIVVWGSEVYGLSPDLTDVVAVSCGGTHTLALKKDGTVVAWGNNNSGQCDVPEGLTGVKAIAAGATHSIALKQDGSIVCWGDNGNNECDVPSK